MRYREIQEEIKAYHGTNKSFDRFELDKNSSGASGSREGPIGFWFTDNPDTANEFAEWSARNHGGNNIRPVKLTINHPLVLKDYSEIQDLVDKFTKFYHPNYVLGGKQIRMTRDKIDYNGLRNYLKQQGYDGIILKDTLTDSPDGKTKINQYVVFDPSQIKSIFESKLFENETRNFNDYYWHGTNSASVRGIKNNGIVSGSQVVIKRNSKYLPPVHNAVYLTPNILTAMHYAEQSSNFTAKNIYVFGVEKSKLSNPLIDEDDIGWAIRYLNPKEEFPQRSEMFSFSRNNTKELMKLTKYLDKELLNNLWDMSRLNHKWLSDCGKILYPYISETLKQKFIQAGSNVAFPETIRPSVCFRIKLLDYMEIYKSIKSGKMTFETMFYNYWDYPMAGGRLNPENLNKV